MSPSSFAPASAGASRTPFRLPPLLLALGLLSRAGSGQAMNAREIYAATAPAVAMLEVLDSGGRSLGRHSATHLGAGQLVSTCDVLDRAASVRVSLQGELLAGRVGARDRERNLCLIHVDGAPAAAVTAQPHMPTTGSRVFAISNALGLGIGVSEGVVSGVRSYPAGPYIQFTAPISPGSEGGALVDDAGALLGIIDYRRRDGQNVNFASIGAWIGDIEKRAAASADALARFDAAMALERRADWAALAALSGEWTGSQPDSRDAWRFTLAAARGLKQRDKEIAAWRALARIDPADAETGLGLGRALLDGGLAEEALAVARAQVAGHREYAPAHALLARGEHLGRRFREAEASYRQALSLDPWLLEAYQGLAALAQQRGDHAAAIAIWTRLAGLFPEAAWPRFGLVQACLAADKPQRAYAVLARLPDKEQDGAAAWYWRGVTEARLGRPEAAIDAFRASLAHRLPEIDRAWAGIGFAQSGLRNYPQAIAAFQAAREASPAENEWRYQLGIVLKDGGRPAEALAIFEALAREQPADARPWRQLGFTLSMLGRQSEAVAPLERSLQRDPAQPRVWQVLIETRQALGQRDAALEAYEKLRAIDGEAAGQTYRSTLAPYEEKAP